MKQPVIGLMVFALAGALSVGSPPTHAGGKGAVAKAVASRLMQRQTSRSATIAANRVAGHRAERAAADNILDNGHRILGSQVSVKTSKGRRVIDHLIQSHPKGRIVAIEVKSGHAIRGPAQMAKDRAMATEGGMLIGKNAPPAFRGKHMIIKTAERHH